MFQVFRFRDGYGVVKYVTRELEIVRLRGMRRRRHGCKLGGCCFYIFRKEQRCSVEITNATSFLRKTQCFIFLIYGKWKIESKQHANIKKEGQHQFKNHLSGRKGIPKQPLRLVDPAHKEWPVGLNHHHAPIILQPCSICIRIDRAASFSQSS